MKFFRTAASLCAGFQNYRNIRDVPISSAIKYLLFLMALLSIAVIASLAPLTVERANNFINWVDQRFPPFSIRDGKVETTVTQPYYSGDKERLFILDTTGAVTNADPQALTGMLFMDDSFLMWFRTTNTSPTTVRQPLRGYPDGQVDGNYVRQLFRWSLWISLPLSYLLLILLGTLTCMLQAYLFSVIASFTERSLPTPLSMNQLLSIAIHAVTPAAIIFTVYVLFRLSGINLWLVYLVAYGVFLIGGTNACRDLQDKERDEEDFL